MARQSEGNYWPRISLKHLGKYWERVYFINLAAENFDCLLIYFSTILITSHFVFLKNNKS